MESADPDEIKQLGRAVQNYDDAQWCAIRFEVVVRANLMKFSQHPELGRILLATGDKILVEASPYDTIWGVGLDESDIDVLYPDRWRGQNLLGNALMLVRSILRDGNARRGACLVDSVGCPGYVPQQDDYECLHPCRSCGHHAAAHPYFGSPLPLNPINGDHLCLCNTPGCYGRVISVGTPCYLCAEGFDMSRVNVPVPVAGLSVV